MWHQNATPIPIQPSPLASVPQFFAPRQTALKFPPPEKLPAGTRSRAIARARFSSVSPIISEAPPKLSFPLNTPPPSKQNKTNPTHPRPSHDRPPAFHKPSAMGTAKPP